jgi:hypothetical protein
MQPSKSREHRMRVLEKLTKLAADRGVKPEPGGADPQLKMPLIVEVKGAAGAKPRVRRARRRSRADQQDFGEL